MKQIVVLLIFFVFQKSVIACDICGCGVGSYYIGIIPQFKKKFVGLRYQYKVLQSHLSPGGNNSYLTTTEKFHTMEFWGATNIGKKFRIMGFVPLNVISQQNQGETKSITGLGDIAAIGYYRLFDQKKSVSEKLLIHSLWAGIGIKLPTGKYNSSDKSIIQNAQNTFQLGTGSTDFIFNTMYDMRIQDIGLNTNLSYKINTPNSAGYRYGNKLTVNVLGYYKFRTGSASNIAPNMGLMYDNGEKDMNGHQNIVQVSGGYSLLWTTGMETTFNRMMIGANFQLPLSQSLANETAKSGNRVMLHISYSF